MRLKDEANDDGLSLDEDEEISSTKPEANITLSMCSENVIKQESEVIITDPVRIIENRIKQNSKAASGIISIKKEPFRDELVKAVSQMGDKLRCGSVRFVCITEPDRNESNYCTR